MPGKPKATHFSEMRNVADGMSRGKARIKVELVPGIATWLIMLSKYYQKAAAANDVVAKTRSVPGAAEAAVRMNLACEHLQWLMDAVPRPFSRQDWEDAAREVCLMLNITPEQMPLYDISADAFHHAIKGVDCATIGGGTQGGDELGGSDDAEPKQRRRKPSAKRH